MYIGTMYVLCVSLSVLLKGCGLFRVFSFSALFLLQTLRNEAGEGEETFREGREGTLVHSQSTIYTEKGGEMEEGTEDQRRGKNYK